MGFVVAPGRFRVGNRSAADVNVLSTTYDPPRDGQSEPVISIMRGPTKNPALYTYPTLVSLGGSKMAWQSTLHFSRFQSQTSTSIKSVAQA